MKHPAKRWLSYLGSAACGETTDRAGCEVFNSLPARKAARPLRLVLISCWTI
jgi:hypothetical protein